MSTMTVLGAPGDVYLLTHSVLASRVGLPTHAHVERIHPHSLQPLARSPRLKGGPMWPGGIAVIADGSIIVVYGRWIHRLDRDCRVKAAKRLPESQAYNSFIVLANGLIVTKNLSDHAPARLCVLDPDTLEFVTAPIECPEPSIARLSAVDNTVYIVGTRSIFRFCSDGQTLLQDQSWQHEYLADSANSYGWDAVIDDTDVWLMDNGKHQYATSMVGRGVHPTANRLLRISLSDSTNFEAVEICGLAGGSITNPPLIDKRRQIVIGYDSANRQMTAWRSGGASLDLLWRKQDIGCASHMLLDAARGHVITNDYRNRGEEVVVLDIASGDELARVRIGGLMQSVVFPSPGWANDIYWCSMGRLARIFVER